MSYEQLNPFDDDSLTFFVLLNEQLQYSLWPTFAALPAGWKCVYGPQSRAACIEYTEKNWLDMRPAGLRTASSAQ